MATRRIRAWMTSPAISVPTARCAEWGMHLIDANLAMGNLLDIAEKQSKAWLAAQIH